MTGTGTQADPYVVETMDEFCAKVEENGAYIELAGDLDCTNWLPPNYRYTMACNQIDGKGHSIKNIHLDRTSYPIAILFYLAPNNQNGVMKNLHWKNMYLNGVCLFVCGRRYGYYWSIQDCSFSMDLFNGRFLQEDYVPCRFKNCGIYLYCSGTSCDPITGDYYDHGSYYFDTCNIEINGTVNYSILEGRLMNTLLTGNVTILNAGQSGSGYPAIKIYNQGNESYSNSLIDMTVTCATTWQIYNYSIYSSGLLVNTTRMQNVAFEQATQIFIPCNDSQMVDVSWLRNQGFDVGETDIGFVWHDWLMNGDNVRVSRLTYSVDGASFPYTVDGSANTFSGTVTLEPNTTCYSEPIGSGWSYTTYLFNGESCHRYKIRMTCTRPDTSSQFCSIWRNGDSWMAGVTGAEGVFKAVDSTSSFGLQVGLRNMSADTINTTFTFTDVQITKYSDWNVVNGKLVNSSLPELPILGAFCNARNLTKIEIPATVKKIGRYAFTNTQLNSVTIASDCTYYDTSFPVGCVINTY